MGCIADLFLKREGSRVVCSLSWLQNGHTGLQQEYSYEDRIAVLACSSSGRMTALESAPLKTSQRWQLSYIPILAGSFLKIWIILKQTIRYLCVWSALGTNKTKTKIIWLNILA